MFKHANFTKNDYLIRITPEIKNDRWSGVIGVDILFDGDLAGREAAENVAELCDKVELINQVVRMPDGLDPGGLPLERVQNLKEWLYGEPNESSAN